MMLDMSISANNLANFGNDLPKKRGRPACQPRPSKGCSFLASEDLFAVAGFEIRIDGRGREANFPVRPAQIAACAANARGPLLWTTWTSNRPPSGPILHRRRGLNLLRR